MSRVYTAVEIAWAKDIVEFFDALFNGQNIPLALNIARRVTKKILNTQKKEEIIMHAPTYNAFMWLLGFKSMTTYPLDMPDDIIIDMIRTLEKLARKVVKESNI